MAADSDLIRRVSVGETITHELPYSEVCMHMHVAGTVMSVQVLEAGAQLLNEDGTPFSFPITHGEAGLYRDADGFYTYPTRAAYDPHGGQKHRYYEEN